MRRVMMTLLLGGLALLPRPSGAQSNSMFGMAPKPPPYVAPHRLFQAQIPASWGEAKTFPDNRDLVEFRIMRPQGSALFQVKREPVGEGAQARQLLARAVEHRVSKLPHFIEIRRSELMIGGVRGASVLGTFWYQGNAQYPRTLEEIYLVLGKEAFTLHFECFQPLSGLIANELNSVYQSFTPRPAGEGAVPAPTDDDDENTINLDNIPF